MFFRLCELGRSTVKRAGAPSSRCQEFNGIVIFALAVLSSEISASYPS